MLKTQNMQRNSRTIMFGHFKCFPHKYKRIYHCRYRGVLAACSFCLLDSNFSFSFWMVLNSLMPLTCDENINEKFWFIVGGAWLKSGLRKILECCRFKVKFLTGFFKFQNFCIGKFNLTFLILKSFKTSIKLKIKLGLFFDKRFIDQFMNQNTIITVACNIILNWFSSLIKVIILSVRQS